MRRGEKASVVCLIVYVCTLDILARVSIYAVQYAQVPTRFKEENKLASLDKTHRISGVVGLVVDAIYVLQMPPKQNEHGVCMYDERGQRRHPRYPLNSGLHGEFVWFGAVGEGNAREDHLVCNVIISVHA